MNVEYDFSRSGDFRINVTTFFAMEDLLAREVQQLGGRNIEPFSRGVSVTGDLGFLYKANLCLQTALKVLVPVARFEAPDEHKLYAAVKSMPWENFLGLEDTFMIEAVLNSEVYTHSLYVSRKVKDAIADRFREKTGRRPDVDLLKPSLRIYVHIHDTDVSIQLDSSGDPLYRRGYRIDIGEAPMKEVLAAGLVRLSGWERHQLLIDGMCGAGTIAIEAAISANRIPAGYYRNDFTCMRWKNFDHSLYEMIYEGAIGRIRNDEMEIRASDIDATMVRKATSNVKTAKVDDVVKVSQESFFDLQPNKNSGVLILNPPYGERIPVADIEKLYKEIGNKLKKDFQGFNCWILTSSPEAVKSIGLRPSRRIKIYNGALECRYLRFEMYPGTKKIKR
jgi:putative N6-adenine-specific DNA methylase